MLLLLFACRARVDLPDVPILGGTDEARALVRAELEAFDAWTGAGRAQLAAIEFRPLDGLADAAFVHARDRVLLDQTVGTSDLRRILRHELCHVLDAQEELLDEPVAPFDALGELLYAPGTVLGEHHRYRKGARGRRSEAFAQVCELGPLAADLLARSCPGDPPLGEELAQWVSEEAWTDYEPLAPAALGPAVAWEASADGLSWFLLNPTEEPGTLELWFFAQGRSEQRWVDLYTGAPAGERDSVASAREAPQERPEGTEALVVGWPSGPGLALVEVDLPEVGPLLRLVASDGGPWTRVGQGCVEADRVEDDLVQLFTADGGVWYAWSEGRAIFWAEIQWSYP